MEIHDKKSLRSPEEQSEERRGKEWWKTEEKRKWTEEAAGVG
jgi:hypothetical protein